MSLDSKSPNREHTEPAARDEKRGRGEDGLLNGNAFDKQHQL
jgi:hypothetical protein